MGVPCALLPPQSGTLIPAQIMVKSKLRLMDRDMFFRMGRPAGLFITAFVYIVYSFALQFEGWVSSFIYGSKSALSTVSLRPFTAAMPKKREKKSCRKQTKFYSIEKIIASYRETRSRLGDHTAAIQIIPFSLAVTHTTVWTFDFYTHLYSIICQNHYTSDHRESWK